MRAFTALALCAAVLMTGCAKTKVTRNPVATGHLPRPATVWVDDFAARAADLPEDSALRAEFSDAAKSPAKLEHGRALGALIATELVKSIRAMGMSAEHVKAGTPPQMNDILIRGCIISFDEGDATERKQLGFGAGESNIKAAAEGLQMTARGLRRIGSGTSDAEGSKTPGTAVGLVGSIATRNPAGLIISGVAKHRGEKTGSSKVEGRAEQTAKEIADVLEERFREQGWISGR